MTIVQTERGPLEVERAGSGTPVLLIHGTPGGADSSTVMGRFLAKAGFEVIAPSRPGYLGTPLDGRGEIDAQADLLAALLDALEVERAGVVTWSGGGPSGYRLTVRHPERVSALVAFAAVSGRYEPPMASMNERLMEHASAGNWVLRFMAAHTPKSTVSATLKAEGDLSKDELKALVAEVMADPDQRDVVLTMAEVVGDYAHRREGIENDLARFAQIDSLELEKIATPTLIVVGDADTDVPPEHSAHAAQTVAGATKLVLEHGTHLALFAHPDAATAQRRVIDLLSG